MVEINPIEIDSNIWEIPKHGDMNVPGRIYSDRELIESIKQDRSLQQVVNVAHLPGIQKYSIAMPDIHWGYGFPIGGVAAFDVETGVISPGGVGYDINCGVRLMKTLLTKDEVVPKIREIVDELFHTVPCGTGIGGRIKLSAVDFKNIVETGTAWSIERDLGTEDDLDRIEDNGCLTGGEVESISQRAFERGKNQLGTLGSGNHFLEIDYIDAIFNDKYADEFGLFKNQVCVLIHCGSRGFGHQICTDYVDKMISYMHRIGLKLPDNQLACSHFNTEEARGYLSAFSGAVNYAWTNRQIIMSHTRDAFKKVLGISSDLLGGDLLYDVSHNIAKFEQHEINGEMKTVCVHRKGATRAFPKNHPLVPEIYREVGQPVLIPGDMGRASYVLVGTEFAMGETFGTCCHGAGRVLSRKKALKKARGRNIVEELERSGTYVRAKGKRTVSEEMPEAYKDVEKVCDVVHNAGIANKVARLRPMGVLKG